MRQKSPEAQSSLDLFDERWTISRVSEVESERPIPSNDVGETFRRQIAAVSGLAAIAAARGQRVIAAAEQFIEAPNRSGDGYQILMRLNAVYALLEMFYEFQWRILLDLEKHGFSRYNAFRKDQLDFIEQTQRQIMDAGDEIASMFGQQFCRFNCAE